MPGGGGEGQDEQDRLANVAAHRARSDSILSDSAFLQRQRVHRANQGFTDAMIRDVAPKGMFGGGRGGQEFGASNKRFANLIRAERAAAKGPNKARVSKNPNDAKTKGPRKVKTRGGSSEGTRKVMKNPRRASLRKSTSRSAGATTGGSKLGFKTTLGVS